MYYIYYDMYSLKLNALQITKLDELYRPFKVEDNLPAYVITSYQDKNFKIDVYIEKKSLHSVNFYGKDAYKIAKMFDPNLKEENDEVDASNKLLYSLETQIGSDEVGAGDFFGPLVVCAVHLEKEDISYYQDLGFADSKVLDDRKILKIVPSILKRTHYSLMVLDNKKYNEMYERGYNLNKLKALLHHQALLNLSKKYHFNKNIYVDKFCSEDLFYRYVKDEKEILSNITFKVHGESHYPSIAIASCIARYAFLRYMQKLDDKYQMHFPFGASYEVIKTGKEFLDKYSIDDFKNVAKLHFKTFNAILEEK